MKFPVRQGNSVELLLDGVNFFTRLEALLGAVRDARPHAGTYVRLAFWEITTDLVLPSGTTIVDALKAVADAGHPVDVIMWCPARLDVRLDKKLSTNVFDKNTATAKAIAGYDSNSGGRIRVLLEHYNGYNGSSTHQKIVICALRGQLSAVVGGMNLAPFYMDNEAHQLGDQKAGMGGPLGDTIHDSAVALEGPAAVDVETEWLRRYKKRFYETQIFGNRGAESDPPDEDPTEYDALYRADGAGQVGRGRAAVQIATTNSESYFGRETDIQNLLVECIRQARSYIYLEGYVISDPTLIVELRKRLRQSVRPKIIVMVPQPYAKNPYPFDYLNYISAVKIGLESCTRVQIGGTWIRRDQCSAWKIREGYNFWSTLTSITSVLRNKWFEDDRFSYTLNGTTREVPLKAIEDFDGAVPFYAPYVAKKSKTSAIYIHSKLALFDDAVAVIGSANFSYRSQVYDGEMSAFVRDGTSVAGIREQLFEHWGLDDRVEGFDESLGRRRGRTHWVTALRLSDFPRISPLDVAPNPLAAYKKIAHTFI
jgi:phosphatidylserine/phosphatidylglycerophosphate/cardiolipin synthase-like enzyme